MPPRFGGPGRGAGPGGFGGAGGRGPMPGSFGFNRPFPHFNYNIPTVARDNSVPGTASVVETYTYMEVNAKTKMKWAIKRKGIIGGTIAGLRVIFSGGIRNQVLQGRMDLIEMQLKENRLTQRQANERKMDAFKKYNRYLLKTGYLTQQEYIYEMQIFAKSLGVEYVYDVAPSGPTR